VCLCMYLRSIAWGGKSGGGKTLRYTDMRDKCVCVNVCVCVHVWLFVGRGAKSREISRYAHVCRDMGVIVCFCMCASDGLHVRVRVRV